MQRRVFHWRLRASSSSAVRIGSLVEQTSAARRVYLRAPAVMDAELDLLMHVPILRRGLGPGRWARPPAPRAVNPLP
jgi:hypothetical protein